MTSEFQKAQQSAAIRDRKRTGGARKISGPFNAYLVEMKRSPAWQVLNMPERRMLERLEEEHNKHGATKNGELIVTYKDFIAARISRKKIKPSQRTIVALGFVEITEQGYGGGKHADDRRPTKFRLTYFRAHDAEGDGTHEWRGITTVEEAVAVATAARHEKPGAPKGHKNSISVPHGGTETADSPVPQKATFQCPGGARLYRDRLGSQPERGAGPHDQACNIGQLRNDIIVALTATYGCAASQAFQALKFFENSLTGQPSLPRQPLSSVPNAAARNGAKLATPTSSVTPRYLRQTYLRPLSRLSRRKHQHSRRSPARLSPPNGTRACSSPRSGAESISIAPSRLSPRLWASCPSSACNIISATSRSFIDRVGRSST